MRKFAVAITKTGARQFEKFVIAESPAQAAIYTYIELVKIVQAKDNKQEDLKEDNIEKLNLVIQKMDEREKQDGLRDEDAMNFVNTVINAFTECYITAIEVPDDPEYDVCLPIPLDELN